MKVLISGASGLIGSGLVAALQADGHDVLRLVRREASTAGEVTWRPRDGAIDRRQLAGLEAAVHLAGAGLGDRRWTRAYRAEIHDSRVAGTGLLARTLAGLSPHPRVLVSASAVGWYGDTGDRVVTEDDPPGTGFLADVCRDWEAATAPAEEAGIRVVHIRSGIVLSARGGVLRRLLPLFRAGLGARLGSGRQFQSWISRRDEVAAIRFLLRADDVRGSVNLTAPEPVRQASFARVLAGELHRPCVLAVPGPALRLALGGFAGEGVLAGQRVLPGRLTDAGFGFADPDIRAGIRTALAER